MINDQEEELQHHNRHEMDFFADKKNGANSEETTTANDRKQSNTPPPELDFNINDGRIWKEQGSSVRIRRPDIPVMQERRAANSEAARTIPRPPMNRVILPSMSAPERSLLKLLEESGIC